MMMQHGYLPYPAQQAYHPSQVSFENVNYRQF